MRLLIILIPVLFLFSCGIERSDDVTITVDKSRCISCHICEKVCPYDAISFRGADDKPVIDPTKCAQCGRCMDNCPEEAITGRRK